MEDNAVEKKPRYLSREECLALDIDIYNKAVSKSMPGKELDTCEHCGRLYHMCCICETAQAAWQRIVDEVKGVEEQQSRERQDKEDRDTLYSDIETLIIMWSNDGTKTAGFLTRQIMELLDKK